MMNKISGILPTSPRIESVDMKNERPLRAGSASFGQPVLKSSERANPFQKETIAGLGAEDFDRTLKNPGQRSDKDIAAELSEAFFVKNRENASKPSLAEEGFDLPESAEADGQAESGESQRRLSLYA